MIANTANTRSEAASAAPPLSRWANAGSRVVEVHSSASLEYLALAAITILAACLRLAKLGAWSFWQDEIFTINAARAIWQHLTLFPPPAVSNLLTNVALSMLGTSEWTSRLTAAVIGTLSVPLLYVAVRRFVNPSTALAFGLLLAVAPWHIYWSQNARFYTSLLLFYTCALFAFHYGLERDRFRYVGLSLALFLLALGERLPALLLVPVIATYLLLVWLLPLPKPVGLRARNLLPVLAIFVGGGVFELYRLVSPGDWLLADFVQVFVGNPITDPARLVYEMLDKLGIPLIAFGVVSGGFLLHRRSRLGLLLLIAACLPIVLLAALSPFVFAEDRYALVTLPAWILLAALGVREVTRRLDGAARVLGLGFLVSLVSAALASLALYYTVNQGNEPDWRAAFGIVHAQQQPGDVLVSTQPEVGDYYLQRSDVERLSDMGPTAMVGSRLAYWFVLDIKTAWASPRIKSWVEQNAVLVAVLPSRAPQDQGLSIYRYQPR